MTEHRAEKFDSARNNYTSKIISDKKAVNLVDPYVNSVMEGDMKERDT